jgi:hypothetical protein
VHKKQKLEKDPKLSATEKRDQMKQLTMDGCPIEDLGLDFTLPGYPNIGNEFQSLSSIFSCAVVPCYFLNSVSGRYRYLPLKVLTNEKRGGLAN